jgi:hypothetical protein
VRNYQFVRQYHDQPFLTQIFVYIAIFLGHTAMQMSWGYARNIFHRCYVSYCHHICNCYLPRNISYTKSVFFYIPTPLRVPVGRDSSVATRYGLDSPGIEYRWWGVEIFRPYPDGSCSLPSLLYTGYRVLTGVKAAGAWRWPPTPPSAEIKEEKSYTSLALRGLF